MLLSAEFGSGNAAVGFVLQRPLNEKQRWSELVAGPRDVRPADPDLHSSASLSELAPVAGPPIQSALASRADLLSNLDLLPGRAALAHAQRAGKYDG